MDRREFIKLSSMAGTLIVASPFIKYFYDEEIEKNIKLMHNNYLYYGTLYDIDNIDTKRYLRNFPENELRELFYRFKKNRIQVIVPSMPITLNYERDIYGNEKERVIDIFTSKFVNWNSFCEHIINKRKEFPKNHVVFYSYNFDDISHIIYDPNTLKQMPKGSAMIFRYRLDICPENIVKVISFEEKNNIIKNIK